MSSATAAVGRNPEVDEEKTTGMETTPSGTSVGVDDPYAFAGRCDHVTDDGRCRFAVDHAASDPEFAAERRAEGYACPVAESESEGEREWRECPHYRSRTTGRECLRCGLDERHTNEEDERPLLEAHHLSYPDGETSHEITVALCRWCHATVHDSWARVDDDASPDPAAIAAREGRRSRELNELAFDTAAQRRDDNR